MDLPSEDPEVFSAVLEYLYKGDYTPKLVFDKKRASWSLDDSDGMAAGQGESTVRSNGAGGAILKDTVIYVRRLYILAVSADTDTACSARRTATPYPNCNASRSRNRAFSPACNAAPFYPRHDTPTPTHLHQTPSSERTISP